MRLENKNNIINIINFIKKKISFRIIA